jgi:hypothetical protein
VSWKPLVNEHIEGVVTLMKRRVEKTAKKGSYIPKKGHSFSEEAQKVFPKQRNKGLNETEGLL